MKRYPLLLGFRDVISGAGFQARIRADGRALLLEEEDGFWVDGVNPGGVAGGGGTLPEALARFRENYRLVLLDAAVVAARFEDFREEILRFFEETCEVTAAEWEEAVREVREGRADVDGLPRVAADRRVAMTIDLVDRPSTTLPVLDEQTSIAA
jgi:hypothetical protein